MEINNKFVEALEENCLNQAVTEPTRQDNILDLVLTTNPSIIENISVEDGMSDHKIVITDINIKTKPKKTVPRKVYIYKKANMNGINQHLDKENKMFLPIIQKQIAFKNVGENLKKYYHRL
jgi:hemerythrin-like domain-containing protein